MTQECTLAELDARDAHEYDLAHGGVENKAECEDSGDLSSVHNLLEVHVRQAEPASGHT